MSLKLVQEQLDNFDNFAQDPIVSQDYLPLVSMPDGVDAAITDLQDDIDAAQTIQEVLPVFDEGSDADTKVLIAAVEHLARRLDIAIIMPSKESFSAEQSKKMANRYIKRSLEGGVTDFFTAIAKKISEIIGKIIESIKNFFKWMFGVKDAEKAIAAKAEAKKVAVSKIDQAVERKTTKKEAELSLIDLENHLKIFKEDAEGTKSHTDFYDNKKRLLPCIFNVSGQMGFTVTPNKFFDEKVLKALQSQGDFLEQVNAVSTALLDMCQDAKNNPAGDLAAFIAKHKAGVFDNLDKLVVQDLDSLLAGDLHLTWVGFGQKCLSVKEKTPSGAGDSTVSEYFIAEMPDSYIEEASAKLKIQDMKDFAYDDRKKVAEALTKAIDDNANLLAGVNRWYKTSSDKYLWQIQTRLTTINKEVDSMMSGSAVSGDKAKLSAAVHKTRLIMVALRNISTFINLWKEFGHSLRVLDRWVDDATYHYTKQFEYRNLKAAIAAGVYKD